MLTFNAVRGAFAEDEREVRFRHGRVDLQIRHLFF
jgi:hypothetical protein